MIEISSSLLMMKVGSDHPLCYVCNPSYSNKVMKLNQLSDMESVILTDLQTVIRHA